MASTMAASLVKPDYSTRITNYSKRPAVEDTVGPLPAIKLAIPKTTFQAPKNGLPINPSPHTWAMDPAIQLPPDGRVSPFHDLRQSPPMEQKGFLSPRDVSPRRVAYSPLNKATQTESLALSRSSSQNSLDCCQYCHGCQRRIRHKRSNTDSSIGSSTMSSSPNASSPEAGETPKKSPSTFGRKFMFNVLQRPSSRESRKTTDTKEKDMGDKKPRKKSVSQALQKKPTKKIALMMVGGDDHWADEY